MKKSILLFKLLPLLTIVFITGCSSMKTMQLNSIQLTNQLSPGMTYTEVESLMGKPKSTQVIGEQMIARWNLQEKWKGYIPYDFVFNASDKTLISWSENQQAYAQKQEQLKFVADELEKSDIANSASSGGGGASASFENDPELMDYYVGSYYSFNAVGGGQTGGTERKLSLCPGGKYYSSSESGYSGDGWGNASQGGGGGTWKITGSKTAGTISFTNASGKVTTYKYESCGNGCYYFGSVKYAYAGKPECR